MKLFLLTFFFASSFGLTGFSQENLRISSDVSSENISGEGFEVVWKTNLLSLSFIKYGRTPALELGIIFPDEILSEHRFRINGANPAELFYVKTFSVSGNDTVSSPTKLFITQSLSTGSIKVYFTQDVDNSVSTGMNAIWLNNVADDTLVQYINRAQESIDIAIYNTTNSASIADIAGALNTAYANGVRVRVIYEASVSNTMILNLNPAINKVASPQGAPFNIMHNKFMVMDAKSSNPNLPIVWTGSMNWTTQQISGTDANNIIIFQDQSLALAYTLEFEEMWGDTGLAPNPGLARFGSQKTDNTPHIFNLNGKTVECYFSPSDSVNAQIINTLNTADSDIEFETMVITRTDIANAITSKVSSGVQTYGLVDDSILTSVYQTLKTGMLPNTMKSHTGKTGILHNKYMIVDQSNSLSDPVVLTGSHNWSTSANTQNDENTVIVHDATVANIYYQEFVKHFTADGGVMSVEESAAEDLFSLYPNPSDGVVNVNLNMNGEIKIYNLIGEEIGSWQLPVEKNESNNYRIDLRKFPSGIYFLLVQTEKGIAARKIIKQ